MGRLAVPRGGAGPGSRCPGGSPPRWRGRRLASWAGGRFRARGARGSLQPSPDSPAAAQSASRTARDRSGHDGPGERRVAHPPEGPSRAARERSRAEREPPAREGRERQHDRQARSGPATSHRRDQGRDEGGDQEATGREHPPSVARGHGAPRHRRPRSGGGPDRERAPGGGRAGRRRAGRARRERLRAAAAGGGPPPPAPLSAARNRPNAITYTRRRQRRTLTAPGAEGTGDPMRARRSRGRIGRTMRP